MSGELEPGTSIAGYRIESFIGRGGMGVVYLAEHVALAKRVALKVVAPEIVRDEAFRDRFLREARLAASLEHPNIIPVFDAGDSDGELYLAMRFVEGENLGDVIKREGRLPVEQVVDVLSKVAGALDEAHRNGLVHRDVKPDNVLLGVGGGVYLTDFGLVRRLDSQSRLTKTGYMMGTLNYMAPEIFRNQEIDGRTDVYSLACVLFECLTGSPPFERDEQPAVIGAHLLDAPPAVTAVRQELPSGIDAVVATGMAKAKEDRFASAGSLMRAASAALSDVEEPLPLPPPRVERPQTRPEGVDVTSDAAPSPSGPEAPKPTSSRRWLLVVAAGLVVAGAALVLPNVLSDEPTGPTGATGEPSTRDPAVRLVATVEGTPGFLDLDFGAVWVAFDDGSSGFLARVDPSSGAIDRVEVGRRPVRITFTGVDDNGSVWTANQQDDSVSRVDVPLSDQPSESFLVGDGPVRLQSPKGSPFVWVANGEGHTLSRIDLETGEVKSVEVGKDPRTISSSPGTVVSANHGDGTISVVDVVNAVQTATIPVGSSPSSILHADPFFWVALAGEAKVVVVDIASRSIVHEVDVGSQPAGLSSDTFGSMWVRNEGESTVSRIDMTSFEEVAQIDVGGRPISMTPTPGAVWVAVADGSVVRIDLDDESVRRFELGCSPVVITSIPDPSTVSPQLHGAWTACEDGSILHIDADA